MFIFLPLLPALYQCTIGSGLKQCKPYKHTVFDCVYDTHQWPNRNEGCTIDESVSAFYACLPSESSGAAWCLCFGHASLSEICNTSCAEWRENIVHSGNDSVSGRTTFLEWLLIRLVHPLEPNVTSVSLRYNRHPTIQALSPLHFRLHAHISWVIWFWRDINWEFMTQ